MSSPGLTGQSSNPNALDAAETLPKVQWLLDRLVKPGDDSDVSAK
jgi:hypothetical protein